MTNSQVYVLCECACYLCAICLFCNGHLVGGAIVLGLGILHTVRGK